MAELALCDRLGCTRDAVAVVTYFTDGNGRKAACGRHLASVMEQVAIAAHLFGTESLRIRPIGAATQRIQRKKYM
jgi:hypothetical protein